MNPSHSVDPTLNSNQPTTTPLTNNLYPPPPPLESQTLASSSNVTEISESNALHRCELMEKGLTEIRTALGALKMTCATLEMHADRLGSEIAALKGVASTTPPLTPMDTQGGMSLNTPPTTPARQTRCLPHSEEDPHLFPQISVHRSPTMSRPSKGILGKRRSSTADLDQNNQTHSSSDLTNPKPNKRVRFADIEGIPTSHVRTPIHRLTRMDSDELMLPIPNNITFRRTGDTTTIASPPMLERATSCPLPSKRPAPMRFQDFNLPIKPLPARARQKTRWDPSTGRRIPIICPNPTPSTPVDTRLSGVAELQNQDDYERRLSDGLSNATLG
ncbi:hypothetical protein M413DRAFT_281950 [Hebeloma cylindrosporum]|uniref:Uncharacterized protein n=1 Tax=Hebeloma cylindrosporum TaxID=76867 RepID=A0A0C3BJI5_HEBCY|nr:hypothetical protein M413DRAFT_281950 [Hebeloma cylindrosporum h7]